MSKVTLEIIPKTTGTGTGTGTGGSSGGAGGLLAAGGKLGVLIGAATAILAILKDMLWVFKPVGKLLSGIIKTLGVFLQPIAEVITLVLRPILIMMKPMLMFFRAMMAPFRQIIQQMSAMASSEAAQGNIEGAMKISTEMVNMIIAPFVVALSTSLGSMLFDMIGVIGNNLISAIYDFTGLFMAVLDSLFGTDLQAQLMADKEAALEALSSGIDIIKSTMIDGSSEILQGLQQNALERLDILKGEFSPALTGAIEDPITDLVNNTNASVSNQETGIPATETAFINGIETINTNTGSYMGANGKTPNEFMAGLETMRSATETFTTSTEAYARRVKSAYNKAKNAADDARDVQIGLINIGSIFD